MPAKEAIELAATSLVAQLRAAAHNEEVAATQFSYLNAANLPPSQPTLELRSDWWGLGIVLSVFATFFGTVGKDLFRLASISSSPSTSYCLVTLGLVFTAGIDPIFNIAALAFATQAIVSACGGFVLVWNVLLAPCILSENLTRIRLMASIFILVGTIGVGLTGPHYEIVRTEAEYFELFLQPQSLVYMGLLVAFCALAAWRWRRAPDTDGRSWGAVLGGAVQGSNFFLKAAIAVVQCSVYPTAGCLDHNPWRSWQVYAVIAMAAAAAAGGLLILALALRHSEALDAVTIFTGTQLVFSALSCNIVLNENQMSYSWIIMLCAHARAHAALSHRGAFACTWSFSCRPWRSHIRC